MGSALFPFSMHRSLAHKRSINPEVTRADFSKIYREVRFRIKFIGFQLIESTAVAAEN
jgi:hypothetical protein